MGLGFRARYTVLRLPESSLKSYALLIGKEGRENQMETFMKGLQ